MQSICPFLVPFLSTPITRSRYLCSHLTFIFPFRHKNAFKNHFFISLIYLWTARAEKKNDGIVKRVKCKYFSRKNIFQLSRNRKNNFANSLQYFFFFFANSRKSIINKILGKIKLRFYMLVRSSGAEGNKKNFYENLSSPLNSEI